MDKEIDDLLEMGVVERSEAPYASPLVLVKKPDNTYRMCVNFKELNKITVFDPEPNAEPGRQTHSGAFSPYQIG